MWCAQELKNLGRLVCILGCVSGCGEATLISGDALVSEAEGDTSSGQDAMDEGTQVDASGLWLDEARYVLEWDLGSAALDEDGQGWTVLNDQGYQVHVERGYLVNYSASLAPCDDAMASQPLRATGWVLAAIDTLMGTSVAHAGHGDEDDPSAVQASRVEDLSRPQTLVMDALTFPGAFYCRFHYLVARADVETEAMPDDTDMENLTLHLEGTWSKEGVTTPFILSTSVNHGTLPELPALLAPDQDVDGTATAVTVTVSRKLDTLFDGLDFAEADAADVERGVLVNLMDQATVQAVLW